MKKHLQRLSHQLQSDEEAYSNFKVLLPFAHVIVFLCERRQNVKPMKAEKTAKKPDTMKASVAAIAKQVQGGRVKISKANAYRVSEAIRELRGHLNFYGFCSSYDSLLDWWCACNFSPPTSLWTPTCRWPRTSLRGCTPTARSTSSASPSGARRYCTNSRLGCWRTRRGAGARRTREFRWCEAEMRRASRELGYSDDWKRAMEYIKTKSLLPGEQMQMVLELAREGANFVRGHDLVTVPPIAEETYRMFMMSAAAQKVNLFLLRGPAIIVSYPTAEIEYGMKQMVMRGNNRHFSKATASHELILGHRLQLFIGERHRSHPQLFQTPFFVEGWAMYRGLVF